MIELDSNTKIKINCASHYSGSSKNPLKEKHTMGILKGTVTFSKYRVVDDLPDNLRDFIDKQIKLFSFRELSNEGEEKSMGWTSIANIVDTDFEYANYSLADYFIFSFRIDRKKVPSSLVKVKALEEEKRFMNEESLQKIGKRKQREIKEMVQLELLKKAPPTPSFYEICWSLSGKWILLSSLSKKVQEDFEEFFKRSFNLSVVPFTPWDVKFIDPETARLILTLEG